MNSVFSFLVVLVFDLFRGSVRLAQWSAGDLNIVARKRSTITGRRHSVLGRYLTSRNYIGTGILSA